MKRILKSCVPLLCLAVVAACDDSTGPSGDVTADAVAGLYAVCNLTFTPDGALPAVRIDTVAFERSTDPGIIAPRWAVDPTTTFQLRYTPKGQFSLRTKEGTYSLTSNGISIDFGTAANPGSLLLPDKVTFEFEDSPQTLRIEQSSSYDVTRADYAAMAGLSETNLAEQIKGKLTATLQAPICL